jgi:imidazolonepropionase-like amidohydrolase
VSRRQAVLAALWFAAAACGRAPAAGAPPSTPAEAAAGEATLADVQLPDGSRADVTLADGRVVRSVPRTTTTAAAAPPNGYLVPAFVDSHVHLRFLPVAPALARAGFAAAVDLGAPEATLTGPPAAGTTAPTLRVLAAGPMLTAPGGYPLATWGQDGYGVGCADAAAAGRTVDRLADEGARVVKVALAGEDGLADAALAAAVTRAHARGLKVAAHALSDRDAARAGRAGVDVLAHTPVEPLAAATIATWRGPGRAVVSTLAAFGGSDAAIDNLARLHAAGLVVLYGTDLGNSTVAGVDVAELALLRAAGLSPDEVVASITSAPAAYWGLADLGFVLLADDPLERPETLARPTRVFAASASASPPPAVPRARPPRAAPPAPAAGAAPR